MEKILHDTSSLIENYRLNVREIEAFTTILNIIEFPKALEISKLEVLYPTNSDYKLAIKLATSLLKIGKPIPAVDIVIAAVALNNKLTLRTKDGHFLVIKDIKPEFKVEIVK